MDKYEITGNTTFDFYKKRALQPQSKQSLNPVQDMNMARKFAQKHPKTYSIKKFSGGERIIRETADTTRIATYTYGQGLSSIEHINKKTGLRCYINTLGGLIKKPDVLKGNKTAIQFNDFKDMLSYFRKNNPLEPSKLSKLFAKVKKFV